MPAWVLKRNKKIVSLKDGFLLLITKVDLNEFKKLIFN